MRRFFGDWADNQSIEAIWASVDRNENRLANWINQTKDQIDRLEEMQTRSAQVLDALGRANEKIIAYEKTGRTRVRIQGRLTSIVLMILCKGEWWAYKMGLGSFIVDNIE